MASNNSNILVDEKLAVSLFLDSLLREPEVEAKQDIAEPEIQTEVEVVEEIATASAIVSDFKLEMPETITEVQKKSEISGYISTRKQRRKFINTFDLSLHCDTKAACAAFDIPRASYTVRLQA